MKKRKKLNLIVFILQLQTVLYRFKGNSVMTYYHRQNLVDSHKNKNSQSQSAKNIKDESSIGYKPLPAESQYVIGSNYHHSNLNKNYDIFCKECGDNSHCSHFYHNNFHQNSSTCVSQIPLKTSCQHCTGVNFYVQNQNGNNNLDKNKNQKQLESVIQESVFQQKQLNSKMNRLNSILKNLNKKNNKQLIPLKIYSHRKIPSRKESSSNSKSIGKIWRNERQNNNKSTQSHKKLHFWNLKSKEGNKNIEQNEYGLYYPIHTVKLIKVQKQRDSSWSQKSNKSLPKVKYPLLSLEVYHDANYRNRRHEKDHLQGTFQLQSKIRKDFIDKIANKPRKKKARRHHSSKVF